VLEDQVLKRTEFDKRIVVAWMNYAVLILRLTSLLEQEQKLQQAGFPRTVYTEEDSDRSEANWLGVFPRFEVADTDVFEHC